MLVDEAGALAAFDEDLVEVLFDVVDVDVGQNHPLEGLPKIPCLLGEVDEEVALNEAVTGLYCPQWCCKAQQCVPNDERDETLSNTIMRWFEKEQKNISETTASFLKQQQAHLQAHQGALERVLLEQQRELGANDGTCASEHVSIDFPCVASAVPFSEHPCVA